MKNLFNYHLFSLLVIFLYITSCQKSNDSKSEVDPVIESHAEYDKNLVDASITRLYEAKGGILHFKNLAAFQETWDKIQETKAEERLLFWKNHEFSSYANEYSAVLQRLSMAKSKVEYDAIYADNRDIIKIDKDDQQRPKIGDSFINYFVNRQGFVYIGKMLYSFGENQQKIAFDGKLSTIQESKNSKELVVLKNLFSIPNAKLSSCTYFWESQTEGGNRRATASTSTNSYAFATGTNHLGQTLYTLRWAVRVTGYPEKKNVWGNWVNYSTTNTLKASFYLYVKIINPPYNPHPFEGEKYVNCNYSNEWTDITYDDKIDFINVIDPVAIQAQQYSYVEKGGVGWNTYSTGGVSEFEYGCP